MDGLLLALNAGSSSIKFGLYDPDGLACRARGAVTGLDHAPRLLVKDHAGQVLADESWDGQGHDAALASLLGWIDAHLDGALAAVGHRIVHGGDFTAPVRLDAGAIAQLESLSPLAPLHQPQGLNAARLASRLRPGVPQVGCFDTAFHASIPAPQRRYALPHDVEARGIRKTGFHGLSFEYIAGQLRHLAPDAASGRIVICHLGSGASLCALADGRSLDTSMGYSPLDGLVMATRCGALDPGVMLRLMRDGMSHEALQDMLYRHSGLLGLSGISGDMRTLLASSDPRAAEAVEIFVQRLVREIAAMVAVLQGVDGIVFTAGIGENAPQIRRRTMEQLAWLGLLPDAAANASHATRISAPASRVACWVIPTDEEQMIARHTLACLAQG